MDQPLSQPLAREFAYEQKATRELVSRMPEDQFDWRPHRRAMSLGRLGAHVVEVVRYGSLVLETDRLDSGRRSQGPLEAETVAALLSTLDEYARAFEAALGEASDEQLLEKWSYCKGDRVIFEVRRLQALRTFVLNHGYHHRGQLSVYLRQLDVALPQIYGPSADDRTGY